MRTRRFAIRGGARAILLALALAVAGGLLLARPDAAQVAAPPAQSAGAGPNAAAPPGNGPDPGARAALATLQGELADAPARPAAWSRGGLRVLNSSISGETWRLAYRATNERTCLLLEVPNTTREGACTPPGVVRGQPVLLHGGGRRDRSDPSRTTDYVVYGLVADTVTSVRLRLSDCSAPPVSLATRPLVWAFAPRAKLRRGVSVIGYDATLRGGGRASDGVACKPVARAG